MTIEQRERIKAHLDELCEWVDEQAYSQSEQEAAADTIEALEKEVAEVRKQRDDAVEALETLESKIAILVDYLQTLERYHRSASQYYMEKGDVKQEDLHDEAFREVLSCEVMVMKLFDENSPEYLKSRISMYADLARSYESRFKV